jgi:hypothetical protein
MSYLLDSVDSIFNLFLFQCYSITICVCKSRPDRLCPCNFSSEILHVNCMWIAYEVHSIICRETREGLEGVSVGLSSNALFTKGLELATQFNMQIKLPSTLH